MAITPATAFGTQMTKLVGNVGGAVQQLLESYNSHGKHRGFIETVTYASQVAGTVIGVARIPLPCVLFPVVLLADTSSGATTLALGNAADGNSAIYKAAAAFTTTGTPTFAGLTAKFGTPITAGIDCLTGLPVTAYASGNGGALYEDIILTLAAATAPASGTLRLFFTYMID